MITRWTRRELGYWSPDHEVYLERGPRMVEGGSSWLIWIKAEAADVETDEWGAMPRYEIFGNVGMAPCRKGARVSLDDRDGDAWYVCTNDAGSLAEAKSTARLAVAQRDARRLKLVPQDESI